MNEALSGIGIEDLTASDVQKYGRQKGKSKMYRGAKYRVQFLPNVKIEIALDSKMAEKVVETIKAASESNEIGAAAL